MREGWYPCVVPLCVTHVSPRQILIMTYHDFIAPCFDKYVPLPDGELREQIEALAQTLQFPLKKLQIVEGSKRY